MGVKAYLKLALFEYLAATVLSTGLVTVLLQGFYVAPELQGNALLIGACCALLLALLYLAGYSRRALLPGALAYLLAAAAGIAVALLTSQGASIVADVEENHLSFAVCTVLVPAAVYLLSRRRLGFLFLLLFALFACGYVQFVFHAELLAPSLAAFLAAAALFVYRGFVESVYAADSVGELRAGAPAAASALLPAACLGLGVLVFALLIAPLEPGHLSVKLFTEYRSFETVEVSNPVVYHKVENTELSTQTITDEEVYGSIPYEVDGSGFSEGSLTEFRDNAVEYAGQVESFSFDAQTAELESMTFANAPWMVLGTLAALLLALLAAVAVRKLLRRRWDARTAALPPAAQAQELYARFLRDLGALGLGKPASQTPAEFAAAAGPAMDAFAGEGGAQRWQQVTGAHAAACFGAGEPAAAQLEACWAFRRAFFANALRSAGRGRYCLKLFWRM